MMTQAPVEKALPVRQCAVCRRMLARERLWRFVRVRDHGVHFDPLGQLQGRGAYLCRQEACLSQAMRRGHLSRVLKVPLSESVLQQLGELARYGCEKSG